MSDSLALLLPWKLPNIVFMEMAFSVSYDTL